MVYLVIWLRGKRGEILVGSRAPKINFPIWRENLRNFILFCFSLYNYIFILSPHLQCSTLQLLHLSFDLFCFLLSLMSFAGFYFILFIFLTLHFYHHTITFTACIFMFCAIPFQLAKVHDFFPQHGSIYWTIPFKFYLTKYNKFNYKEKIIMCNVLIFLRCHFINFNW